MSNEDLAEAHLAPFTAVPCSYCNVETGEPCVSSGGYEYTQGAHAARYKLAKKKGLKVTRVPLQNDWGDQQESQEMQREVDARPQGRATTTHQRLKLAIWYIDKAGGVDAAREAFEAVANAVLRLDKAAAE